MRAYKLLSTEAQVDSRDKLDELEDAGDSEYAEYLDYPDHAVIVAGRRHTAQVGVAYAILPSPAPRQRAVKSSSHCKYSDRQGPRSTQSDLG